MEDEEHDTSSGSLLVKKLWFSVTLFNRSLLRERPRSFEDVEPVLKEGGPLSRRELGLDKDEAQKIISRMM
ncbi:MAG: hypothetical protein Ct9H300mP11_10520 [Chloroflexota bacterium]|nr:MAG: hypothetical protein Ct9H300mP11_10520 [Chloroflexota bacterium]